MMLPCLGGIVARDFSDDSSDDEPRPTTTVTTSTTTNTSIKPATPFGFPKAAKRQVPEPKNNNNTASSTSSGATASKTVYFDPATTQSSITTTVTKPTPKARSSAPSAMVGEKPLSDEELSLMGWWVTDPVGRMGCATNCAPPSESDAVPESGSQLWLSRRSELMSVEKRLSTLVRCMQSSAPQHQRSFLSVSRALLKQNHHTSGLSEVGNRLRGLFITDGTDSAMRWFRLFQIIEESSTGAYRHRGAVTTPMPVITEEGLGLVGDILRPFMAPLCSSSFLADLANPEPLRAENVAAQLVDVLRGRAEQGEGEDATLDNRDKPLSVETLLVPPCPTFEEIGTLLVSVKTEKTTTSSDRVEFEAAVPGGAAERALMTGINLEEPVTNRTIEAFNTAYYGKDDDVAENNQSKQERDLGVPVHQLALALTHLAAPELILHLLSESFELARSTSMSAVSIADNRQQSPLGVTALLRFALFLCEHHPLASHRLALTELQPQQQQIEESSDTSQATQISKKSSSVAAKCTVLRILDSLTGMLVEDYEQLLMGSYEETEEEGGGGPAALLDVMFLTARFMGYLIPAAVATEQLSLHDPANASDILRMVAALSTATIRKATDVLVLSIGLMEQLESGSTSGDDNPYDIKTTQAWLACWITARTAVVHEALLEHERSAKGGDAAGFACSSAASELLPLALRWTTKGSLILGGAVHQASQATSSLDGNGIGEHTNVADVKLLRSAGGENALGQDPSGWTQTMVSSACAILVASSNNDSNNVRNGSELYRLVAAVYLVAQYRKCKIPASTTASPLLLLVEKEGDNSGAFTPLGQAMWDFVQEGLGASGATSQHHLGLTVSVVKDLVEELVSCCEGIEPAAPIDDFDFTEDASTATTTPALQALVSLVIAIGSLVEHTLHPVFVSIRSVSQSDRRNTLLTSLGMLTPEVADSLLQAVIVMETVSMSSLVYPSVKALLPVTTASLLASPIMLIALAAITATRTEATQQAPLLVAAVVNRYLKTVVSAPLKPNAIGAFMVKLDELLSTSQEYYDPTSLFGFRRPIVNDGGVDLKQIEEFGEAAGMLDGDEEENTVMNAKAADNTAMLLIWRIMTTSMVWLQNGNADNEDGIEGIMRVLVDTEGLFSEVLMWRLQAASAGITFPSITTSTNDVCRPVYECVLTTLCQKGIDSSCTPLWPLTQLPAGALGRYHAVEVVSDLILTVIGTPVTTSSSRRTVSAVGGWTVIEKELGPLTESLGFQAVPPSVIRALLGSLAAATPLLSSPSGGTTSLAASISAPPPTTLVAMVRLICTDGFLASYNALQCQRYNHTATSSPPQPTTTSNNRHVPLMEVASVRSHAQQQQQGDGTLPLPPWSEQQVITMAEEFGSVVLRHTQTLISNTAATTSSSLHPLHVVAHLIRWASACTLLRRKAFVPDAPDALEIATDIVSELGLEQYQLLA